MTQFFEKLGKSFDESVLGTVADSAKAHLRTVVEIPFY
jgi:hypothetical protein